MATESKSLELSKLEQASIAQLSKHVGNEVVLKGWLYNLRSSGKILFPQLRDGTGVVQCVVLKNAIAPEVWESLKALGQESALIIQGTVRAVDIGTVLQTGARRAAQRPARACCGD